MKMPEAMREALLLREPHAVLLPNGDVHVDVFADCARRGVPPTRENQLRAGERIKRTIQEVFDQFGATAEFHESVRPFGERN